MRLMVRWLGVAAAVYGVDQLTKLAVVEHLAYHVPVRLAPFLELTLVYNTGAAFGFLSAAGGWQNALFTAIAAAACIAILVALWRLKPGNVLLALALSLILGGAAGNLSDRLLRGHVVDFIDVHYRSWHWPAFNAADSAITVGAILLALDALEIGRRRLH